MISSSLNEEMSSRTDEMEAELDVGGIVGGKVGLENFLYALRKFRKDCKNFARIVKIL